MGNWSLKCIASLSFLLFKLWKLNIFALLKMNDSLLPFGCVFLFFPKRNQSHAATLWFASQGSETAHIYIWGAASTWSCDSEPWNLYSSALWHIHQFSQAVLPAMSSYEHSKMLITDSQAQLCDAPSAHNSQFAVTEILVKPSRTQWRLRLTRKPYFFFVIPRKTLEMNNSMANVSHWKNTKHPCLFI